MDPSVAAAWPAVCRAHEGSTTWMYLDTKGLVTTGVGFLIDSPAAAQRLPWRKLDGTRALSTDIDREWREVKALQLLKAYNGLSPRWRDRAKLLLSEVDVDAELARMTPRYWSGVVKSAPNVDQAPPNAQLALIDLAWQNGPAFLDQWTDTRAAVRAADWTRVASLLAGFLKPSPRTSWRVAQFRAAAAAVKPKPTPEVPVVKWLKSSRWGGKQYRKWRGGNMTPTGIAVCEAIPSTIRIMQGGLSTSVTQSANTHAGLGAYDVDVQSTKAKTLAMCAELIRSGEAAFPRGSAYGSPKFAPHVHVVSANDAGSLHPEAKAQLADFKRSPRRNGLVGHARYVGPSTPLGSWKDSPYNPANIKPPAAKQYRVVTKTLLGLTVDRKQSKKRARGFVIDADRLVRRWGRWNVVTTASNYYAVSDSKQKYLEPITPPAASTTKKAA